MNTNVTKETGHQVEREDLHDAQIAEGGRMKCEWGELSIVVLSSDDEEVLRGREPVLVDSSPRENPTNVRDLC